MGGIWAASGHPDGVSGFYSQPCVAHGAGNKIQGAHPGTLGGAKGPSGSAFGALSGASITFLDPNQSLLAGAYLRPRAPWSPPASPRTARRSPHFLEAANFWGVRHFSRPQPFTFSRTLSSAACPLEPPANPRSARKSPHFSKVAGFGGSDRSLRTSSTAVWRTLPSAAGPPGTPMVSSEAATDPPWAPSAPLLGRQTQFERRPVRSFPAPASAGFVHWSHPPIPFFSRRGGRFG